MVSKNEHATRSHCPVAIGLDLLGDHWTLLIVRDLLLMGRHEFRDFLNGDEGISSNILTDRLNKLQGWKLVKFIFHPENKRRKLYYLTPKGKTLINVIGAIAHWSLTEIGDAPIIPNSISDKLLNNPKAFRQQVLTALSDWEAQYHIENLL